MIACSPINLFDSSGRSVAPLLHQSAGLCYSARVPRCTLILYGRGMHACLHASLHNAHVVLSPASCGNATTIVEPTRQSLRTAHDHAPSCSTALREFYNTGTVLMLYALSLSGAHRPLLSMRRTIKKTHQTNLLRRYQLAQTLHHSSAPSCVQVAAACTPAAWCGSAITPGLYKSLCNWAPCACAGFMVRVWVGANGASVGVMPDGGPGALSHS